MSRLPDKHNPDLKGTASAYIVQDLPFELPENVYLGSTGFTG